jgi:TPR repeat protein
MRNTSTIHIKTDFDCKVYDYGQELGTTKADTYFNIELRKGEHELSFVFTKDESISKTINYIVEEADCDYRLIVEITEIIYDKAKEQYHSENYPAAFELFSITAEKGFPKSQNGLGVCYYEGKGVEKDYTKAVEWYTRAANQGYVKAQYNLGICYEYGDGIEKNISKAVEWYAKAADQGDADAQCYLGYCYEQGNGVEKDYTKAVEWYTKAADQGHSRAQFNLGVCYFNGNGVEVNRAIAVEWYTKAADQDHSSAQFNLGVCYEYGYGIEKNISKAVEWYTKAADQGVAEAQYHLGVCYFNGNGVEKNLVIAVEWYTKAADQGHEKAQKAIIRLKQNEKKPFYYLFFDTETAGLPYDYNAPTYHLKNWPRLVQLSWITTDEDCNILSENDYIIYPDGFTIPEDAVRLHGITTEIAKEKGRLLKEVIDKFMEDFNAAETIVGHNIAFDKKIIGAELIRLGQKDIMHSKKSLCTMEVSTDYCKIPGYRGYKWPKLQELHKKLFGCEFKDAHNSMSDVTATLKCFKKMKELGII